MKKQQRDDLGLSCYRRLRKLLIYGQLSAGERLREVDWAQRLGAHRTAVREALVLLSHDGLLSRGERGGFFVPEYTAHDIEEVIETRLVVELGAIQLVAKKGATEKGLDALDRMCENMQRLIDSELLLGYIEADRKFHELLVGLARSRRLNAMFAHSPLPHLLPGNSATEVPHSAYEESLKDHFRLAALLRDGQFQEARELLDGHISRSLSVSDMALFC